jgi:pSer/pThr/pTyr-binding forkhead associated (FHA) protein
VPVLVVTTPGEGRAVTEQVVASSKDVRLAWTPPGGQPQERALTEGVLTIGRGEGSDLIVDDPTISRAHARLTTIGDAIVIEDLGSRNGTLVNGDLVARAELRPGDTITVGRVAFELLASGHQETMVAASADGGATMLSSATPSATLLAPIAAQEMAEEPEDPLSKLLRQPIVSETDLARLDVDVKVADVLALGSGLGSFVFVDALRVSGVGADRIVVIGNEAAPYSRYQRLCRNSQIPPHERLRSNSDSCPDNIWGFPGYAVRENWGNLKRGDIGTTLRVLWQIFGESAIADTYTPRSGDVFDAIAEESQRIGWDSMLRFGRIRTIRKTAEGRILAIASEGEGAERRRFAVAAPVVHLSLGYPSIQLLPDLAEYRERTGDRRAVVNAYEPHDHVYEQLGSRGGSVILRGRGIVASRVLQRLWEGRDRNKNITVIHLHRSPLKEGRRYGWSQRKIHGEFEFQAFNWPKGCWTGPQRYALEAAAPEERKRLLDLWGGTTTANRRDWRNIVSDGLSQGWYRQEYGVVRSVDQLDNGRIRTRVSNSLAGGGALDLDVDFMIDCTGLIASPERAPVLDDLIETYGVRRNPLGRFHVTNDFELPAMRHGSARMFAAGATTLGGPFATVDSFLGLQYAGLRAVNAIADNPVPGQHRLRGLYSFWQWTKWARGIAP